LILESQAPRAHGKLGTGRSTSSWFTRRKAQTPPIVVGSGSCRSLSPATGENGYQVMLRFRIRPAARTPSPPRGHPRRPELSNTGQRVPSLLRHGEGGVFARARVERLSLAPDARQHHRSVAWPRAFPSAREYGGASPRSFGGSTGSAPFSRLAAERQEVLLGRPNQALRRQTRGTLPCTRVEMST